MTPTYGLPTDQGPKPARNSW